DMGRTVMAQMFGNPRALLISAGIIGMLGLVPGMPNLTFLLLAVLCFAAAWWHRRRTSARLRGRARHSVAPPDPTAPAHKELTWEDVPAIDVIGLEVGYGLIPLVDRNQGGQLLARIKGVRKKLSQDLGFLIQPVHIRDNLDLAPSAYRISVLGVAVAEAEV